MGGGKGRDDAGLEEKLRPLCPFRTTSRVWVLSSGPTCSIKDHVALGKSTCFSEPHCHSFFTT